MTEKQWQPISTAPTDGQLIKLRGSYPRQDEITEVTGFYETGGYTEGWTDERHKEFWALQWAPIANLGDQPVTDEYLTGAELMYAIGDAMAAGEGPETFETQNFPERNWIPCSDWMKIVGHDRAGQLIRRKPRVKHLIDQNGQRHEWPEPFTTEPPYETPYYVPVIGSDGYKVQRYFWKNMPWDWGYLQLGMAHKTWSAVEQMARALLMASGWDGQRND